MLNIILLSLDFVLFVLSFVYIILDIKNYQEDRYKDLETNQLPKMSSRGLLFGLLALILAVIISFIGI
ncbi:MAG: hypothetical protein ACFE8N_11685 [Promethearchaeota archaeon]